MIVDNNHDDTHRRDRSLLLSAGSSLERAMREPGSSCTHPVLPIALLRLHPPDRNEFLSLRRSRGGRIAVHRSNLAGLLMGCYSKASVRSKGDETGFLFRENQLQLVTCAGEARRGRWSYEEGRGLQGALPHPFRKRSWRCAWRFC